VTTPPSSTYLLAGQMSELERLQLQARVWEPAGQALLERLGTGWGLRAVDVGCGCFGWLRILNQWVDPGGTVTGTDVDSKLLDAARALIEQDGLGNVTLVQDDLFDSRLEPHTFDLREAGFDPEVRAEVYALAPGHPYVRLPLQFSVSLEPRLLRLVSRTELEELRQRAEAELAQPGRWGTTFTLVQAWARAVLAGAV
jgi:SAM-dependent methyltransferase